MKAPNQLLALWAHPRSRSTAFYRMMQNRGDFLVIHEPFCTLSDTGSVQIPDAQTDTRNITAEAELIDALLALAQRFPVFFKETTDHRYPQVEASHQFLKAVKHCFIVRDPKSTIASHFHVNPEVSCDAIGYQNLYRIYKAAADANPRPPLVLEADCLVGEPEATIARFCQFFELQYDASHLAWNPGNEEEWGRTQKWHTEASASTGFHQQERKYPVTVDNSETLKTFYDYHLEYYQFFEQASLK